MNLGIATDIPNPIGANPFRFVRLPRCQSKCPCKAATNQQTLPKNFMIAKWQHLKTKSQWIRTKFDPIVYYFSPLVPV